MRPAVSLALCPAVPVQILAKISLSVEITIDLVEVHTSQAIVDIVGYIYEPAQYRHRCERQPLDYYKTEGQGESVPGYDIIDDLDETLERPMWQAEYELATDRQQVEKIIDFYDFYIP